MIQKAEQNSNIGIVLCDCGGTLRNKLDFEKLQKYLEQLPAVRTVKVSSKLCQQKECTKIMDSISKKKAKRMIIGACDEEVFEKNLRQALADEVLNQGLLWCVNIREHCSWVTNKPKPATDKAKEILAAAIRRLKLATAIKSKKTGVNQDVLVHGGGVAAMQTAIGLSQLGHKITLVTKDESLGAPVVEMPELYAYVAADLCDAEALVKSRADELIRQVTNDKRIRFETNASLKSIVGEFGNFTVVVDSNGTERKVGAGAIVLANGLAPQKSELADLIHNDVGVPKRIAIMLDIFGEQSRAVSAQVLSAAELLVKRFGAEVKLYCHNIRVATMGLESLYRRAREAGVVVVKYESPPAISEKGAKKVVLVEEPEIGCEVSEEFDQVIMADNVFDEGNGGLLSLIEGLRAGPEGTLQADNVWLLPTKTNREGILVAGSTPETDGLRDSQADGLATANQIHELLKNKQIEVFDDSAVVDADKCVLCLTCMRMCPHGAVSIDVDNKTASVSAIGCQRCGICAAQCPAGAIQLPQYTDEQIAAEIGDKPQITVFACENSAYAAATAAGVGGFEYAANIRLIRVPCSGKVDERDVLRALERGAEKVLILGCHPENCRYLDGSSRTVKRIERLNNTLEKAGIDKKRVVFGPLASIEPGKFLEYVKG